MFIAGVGEGENPRIARGVNVAAGRTDGRTDGQEEFLVHWGKYAERETERVRCVSHFTFCKSNEA